MQLLDRYLGCLLGLAAGDALGTTCEFSPPGSFAPLTDIVGGGPFDLEAGEWTDDTSMALCLAESPIETGKFDAADQMRRYVSWYRTGHLSSNGRCFDIGGTVRAALDKFERTGDPLCGETAASSAGNGSLMRLASVPMRFAADAALAISMAADSSKTTHDATAAIDACRFYTGYVVKSLEAALWAFCTTDDFKSGCLKAANLGDDADTTAAIYGQLAGAYYGVEAIPFSWLDKLAKRDLLESMALKLYEASR